MCVAARRSGSAMDRRQRYAAAGKLIANGPSQADVVVSIARRRPGNNTEIEQLPGNERVVCQDQLDGIGR